MKTLDQLDAHIAAAGESRTPIDAEHTPGTVNAEFVISNPGSYYLPANVGVTKTDGIRVLISGVTIDLNGFQIARVSGAAGGTGIPVGIVERTTIKNGSISGFAFGLNCLGSVGSGIAQHLYVTTCTGSGVRTANGWLVEGCQVQKCGSSAIGAGTGCTVRDCTVSGCTGAFGISSQGDSTFSNCSVTANSEGIAAFSIGGGSTMVNCTASDNVTPHGISASNGTTVTGCVANGNNDPGGSSSGFFSFGQTTFVNCTAQSNFTSSASKTKDTGVGIFAGDQSIVRHCVANGNGGDGVSVGADCVVAGNSCNSNGLGDGAGVHATGAANRIEGNNVVGNPRGLDIAGAVNLIFGNSARANSSNYTIVAGNRVGAIVVPPLSAAITANGNAAGLGTTDPWANFAY